MTKTPIGWRRRLSSGALSVPSTGIMSLAGMLRMHGHTVKVVDLYMGVPRDRFLLELKSFAPDLVGISCYTESYAPPPGSATTCALNSPPFPS